MFVLFSDLMRGRSTFLYKFSECRIGKLRKNILYCNFNSCGSLVKNSIKSIEPFWSRSAFWNTSLTLSVVSNSAVDPVMLSRNSARVIEPLLS